MKVALYAQVSSEKKTEKCISVQGQMKALRKYALKHGWEVCREFVDEVQSARTTDRSAFKEMVDLAMQREKPFDAILVWKLSRLARNRADSVVSKALLKKHGVSVISVNEPLEGSPHRELMEGLVEAVNMFHSQMMAEARLRALRRKQEKQKSQPVL